jgi:hypothetical protein
VLPAGKRAAAGKPAVEVKVGDAIIELTIPMDGVAMWSNKVDKPDQAEQGSAKGSIEKPVSQAPGIRKEKTARQVSSTIAVKKQKASRPAKTTKTTETAKTTPASKAAAGKQAKKPVAVEKTRKPRATKKSTEQVKAVQDIAVDAKTTGKRTSKGKRSTKKDTFVQEGIPGIELVNQKSIPVTKADTTVTPDESKKPGPKTKAGTGSI